MIKKIVLITSIILIGGFVMSQTEFSVEKSERDIPSPLNPSFVKQVFDCGKIDLIDRNSKSYNPRALVDGSLKECGN